jgi:maltooligosyltrehalose synthase
LPLPGGGWRNSFSGRIIQREVAPAELFEEFPVALLVRDSA